MKLEKFKEKNKKQAGIILFTISCILLVTIVFIYNSFASLNVIKNFNAINGNINEPGDLYFSYFIDDKITEDIPTKESGYTLASKSTCTNGVTVSWDEENWTAIINYSNYKKNLSSKVKCTLFFEVKT